jgi:hypothetical protein
LKKEFMTAKLTITLKKDVMERAKYFARNSGRSLSALIEQYLDTLTQESSDQKLSPKLKKLIGVVNLPTDFDEKKEYEAYIENKRNSSFTAK